MLRLRGDRLSQLIHVAAVLDRQLGRVALAVAVAMEWGRLRLSHVDRVVDKATEKTIHHSEQNQAAFVDAELAPAVRCEHEVGEGGLALE